LKKYGEDFVRRRIGFNIGVTNLEIIHYILEALVAAFLECNI
jgi:hypothetical protein